MYPQCSFNSCYKTFKEIAFTFFFQHNAVASHNQHLLHPLAFEFHQKVKF